LLNDIFCCLKLFQGRNKLQDIGPLSPIRFSFQLQRPEDPIHFLAQYFTDYKTEKVKDEPGSPMESEENENMEEIPA
jgi:hypothetical protein